MAKKKALKKGKKLSKSTTLKWAGTTRGHGIKL